MVELWCLIVLGEMERRKSGIYLVHQILYDGMIHNKFVALYRFEILLAQPEDSISHIADLFCFIYKHFRFKILPLHFPRYVHSL